MRAQLATADILGTVADSSGAVVPGAKVTLVNTGTGIATTTKSDKTGEFLFSHVQIGTFKVTVEASGFKNFVTNGVSATTGDRVRINARLEIGTQVETVEVQASVAATLQTDTSNIASEISANEVAELPTNGRNVYSLIGLQAGVTAGTSSGGEPTDTRPTMSFSANGQSSSYNNNMIDGMDNNERSLGSVAVEPSLDALQEVKVETNMYSAEYSRTGGGIANLITKSGSNQFHGTLFEFMRNDAFDSYSWGSAGVKSELRQNQFGGSIGGPIIKNKAFFFGDYQGWRQVKGSVAQNIVPTQAEYDSLHAYANGTQNYVEISDQWGATGTLTDPVKLYDADTPHGKINKLGLAYLLAAPAPTCTDKCTSSNSYNWYGPSNTVQYANTYDGRVDYHINANNTLYGRFSYNKTDTTTPVGWPATTIASGVKKTYTKGLNINPITETNLALDYVHVFSPTTLFEAKASYLRPKQIAHTGNLSWTMDDLGYSCDDVYCYNSSNVVGLPSLFFSNAGQHSAYNGTQAPYSHAIDGDGGQQGFTENTFQYNASLTMNRKSHSIKTGITLIRRQVKAPASSNTNIYYSSQYTGNAISDMLNGEAVEVDGSKKMIVPYFRMWEPSAYIQDDWRVTSKLTLNLGIRYDIYSAWTERYGHISNFDLDSALIVSPSLLGDNQGNTTANVNTDYGNIAPRIGFAYSLPYSMVIRGGVGLSYFPASTGGQKQFEMLNAPFMWGMTCGNTDFTTTVCSSSNGYMSTANYTSRPYGLSDGGYDLQYGLPLAQYQTDLATKPAYYASSTSASYFIPFKFKNSYLEQFNVQLQKQYKNHVLTAGLVGSLGRRIPSKQNVNQPIVSTSSPDYSGHYPMYTTAHDWMDGVNVYESLAGSNSSWIGGEATYDWHSSYGFNASVNFTWARNASEATNANKCVLAGCPMDDGKNGTIALSGWRQYSYDGSTSHRAAGNLSYNLPFGKTLTGPLGAAVKGWTLNGTGFWNTGAWTAITSGVNQSGISTGTEYPNRVAGVSVKPKHQTLAHWINENAFSEATQYTLGNGHNSSVQGPRTRSADVGLGKNFSVWENLKLQFRAEAFNVTNTPSYSGASGGGPGSGGATAISSYGSDGIATIPSNSSFGNYTNGSGDREMQFGLKLIF